MHRGTPWFCQEDLSTPQSRIRWRAARAFPQSRKNMKDFAPPAQTSPVFISYSSSDLAWARWVDWQLRSSGHMTVMQHYDHEQGGEVDQQIARAIAQSEVVLALLSPAYERSTWCGREWERADQLDKLRQLVVQKYTPSARYARRSYKVIHDKAELAAVRTLRDLLEGTPRPTQSPGLPADRPGFPGSRKQRSWRLLRLALGTGLA
ncbi:MAG TPA: toll/interleukin-1 receptor domain-containing protein, partial [Polyangiales bacterium]